MTISAPTTAPVSANVTGSRTYLMCPPAHFGVTYRINPWMRPDLPADRERALVQWTQLRGQLLALGHRVHDMPAQPGLPDLVFTANGGLVVDGRALVPRFRHRERAREAQHFAAAFRTLGIRHVRLASFTNEGEGDFRLVGGHILAGHGLRSDRHAAREVSDFFRLPVVPLRLIDPRFYHLDTALAVLDDNTIAYWPGAFDGAGQAALRRHYPDAVTAAEAEVSQLGLNMISDGRNVIMSAGCTTLRSKIEERGFDVVELPIDEFRKAGGGPKCCVLELHSRR